MAHPIVVDGIIMDRSLQKLGKSRQWLEFEIKKRNKQAKDIFLMTLGDDGKIILIEREDKK
jgi:uncharacterized membrane protein YcaP (DUF421 family)